MKSNLIKRMICVLLALLAVMGISSATALAAESTARISGTAETDTPISVVHTYINPPHPGQKLDFDAEKSELETGYIIDGVRWLDSTGNICTPGTVAEPGKTYTVEIYIYANSGHMFTRFGGIFNGYINKEKIPLAQIQGYANDEDRNLCLTTSIKCVEPIVTIKNNGNTGAVETRGYTTYGGDPLYYHTLNAKSVSGKVFKLWKVIDSDSGKLLDEVDTPYYKYTVSTPSNITFEAVYESGKTISNISISGVKEPIIWICPGYKAQVDPDSGYEIWTDCPLDNVKNGVRWYDASGKQYIDPAESDYTFLEGRKYLVEVFIKAKDGYNFADFTEKECTFNSVTGKLSKPVSGYSPLEYLSVGVTYESKDISLEIYGPDGLVSSSLHAAGSVTDITAPFADGMVFTGWEITGGRGKIGDTSKFNTQFWLPGDGTGLVKLKANYKDAAEELCPLIEDIRIDDVSVGIRPAAQNLIADNEYNLQFNWGIPSAYYKAGYRLISKIYIPDHGWLDISSSNPSYDKDCVCFTFSIPVTGTAGTQQNYRLSLTLADPEGRKFSSALELNTVILRFHNIIIDKQPQSVTVANGQTVKTTVVARGNGLTYEWYYKNAGASSYTKSSIISATYTSTMYSNWNGRQMYCKVTDKYGNSVDSEVITFTISNPVKITAQPTNVTAASGAQISTKLVASGDGLTYAWYYKNAGASSYTKSSITSATYTSVMYSNWDGRQMYCKVTDKYGNSVDSDVITFTIGNSLKITAQPESVTAPVGTKISTKVVATGDGLTYAWYYKNAGASSYTKSSITSATYTSTMYSNWNGRQMYCKITDKYGNSVDSDVITFTIGNSLKITAQPESVTAPVGETISTKVVAEGDGLTYTWYYKNADATSYSKSSVTKDTYSDTMKSNWNGRKMYCKVTDKYGNSVDSDVITFTLSSAVRIAAQPTAVKAASGAKISTKVVAEGEGLTYTWYYKNAGESTYTKSSITSAIYTSTMYSNWNGRQMYCKITDKYGNSVLSDVITFTIGNTLKITAQPESVAAPVGKTITTKVAAAGDGLTYTWYYKNAGASSYTKSSITSATYSTAMLSNWDGRKMYCKVTDKYGNSACSDIITFTIGNPAKITTQPVSISASVGGAISTKVAASGDGLTYEWYYKNAGASYYTKSSITSATYSTTMLSNWDGRQMYCKVTDMYGNSVNSDVITLTIK